MNNLFLREKENWLTWCFWGVLGAVAVFFAATGTNQFEYVIATKVGFFALLTWYMTYLKRFSFLRAMKVTFLIFCITSAPVVFISSDVFGFFENVDVLLRLSALLVIGLFVSVVSSLIVRQPKEYY